VRSAWAGSGNPDSIQNSNLSQACYQRVHIYPYLHFLHQLLLPGEATSPASLIRSILELTSERRSPAATPTLRVVPDQPALPSDLEVGTLPLLATTLPTLPYCPFTLSAYVFFVPSHATFICLLACIRPVSMHSFMTQLPRL